MTSPPLDTLSTDPSRGPTITSEWPPPTPGPSLFSPPSPPEMSDPSPYPDPSLESPTERPYPSSGVDGGSPPRSTRSKRKQLREAAGAVVLMVGVVAHKLLTRRGSLERQHELYVPDEEDQKAIGDPLAGLASRRLPEGADNPDLSDGLGLLAGLVAYVFKQVDKRDAIAEEYAAAAAVPEDMTETQNEVTL